MLYNINYDIAAILLTAMLILIISMRRTYPTKTCTLYKIMLWLNLVSSIADAVSAYAISYAERIPLPLNYACSIIYLCAHNLTSVVFLIYVIGLVRGNFGNKFERIFWGGIAVFDVLALLTTPFTKLVFYFDETLTYQHGPLMYVLYVLAFSIMFYAGALFIRHRHILNVYQMTTNIAFLSLIIIAVAYQFFYTYVLIESFCCAIAFLMLNIALDNPSMYFYRNTECFNHTAFNLTLAKKANSKNGYCFIAFTFDDIRVFRKKFGSDAYNKMILDTINISRSLFGHKRVYMLSNSCVAIDVGDDDVEAAVDLLSISVGKNVDVGNTVISLTPHFCVVRSSDGYESADVGETINYLLFDVYRQTGQSVIYNDTKLLEEKQRETQIVHILHDAIENDGFEVYYQPIYDQRMCQFVAAEALVRLKNQTLESYIGPDVFIPVAENNGMILDIGAIVFEKVCRFWSENKPDRFGIKYIEVNLSILQLLEKSMAERLVHICERYGLSPKNFNFEITETASAGAEEKPMINESIRYLAEKGFSFSLDDYGSGYSTATYIAEMPFNIVKIDREILWNAMKKKNFRIVLNNSVALIREFGKECVVEGVETEEMAETLRELGCDYFQGYLYSRPLPEKNFVDFLSGYSTNLY